MFSVNKLRVLCSSYVTSSYVAAYAPGLGSR